MSLRRLQSLLFLAVAFGAILFTSSTLVNELRARSIDSDIEASTQNGLPSIELLNVRQITVRASRGGGVVRIEIEDTGPGIPPGTIDRIFEPYVRVGGGQQVGLGLGLATVKRFSEACGGSVRVHSVVGVGCTFTVELPDAARA